MQVPSFVNPDQKLHDDVRGREFSPGFLFILLNSLLVFSFLFKHIYTNIILLLLAVFFLIQIRYWRFPTKQEKVFLIGCAVFLLTLTIVAIVTSRSISVGLKNLEKYGLLITFPLMLSLLNCDRIQKKYLKIVPWSFTISVLIAALYSLSIGVYNFLLLPPTVANIHGGNSQALLSPWTFLSYERLLKPLQLSPSYTSLFVSFAFFFVFFERKNFHRRKWVVYILLIFFATFILLIGSRIGVIAFLLCLVVTLMASALRNSTSKKRIIIYVVSFIVLFSVVISFNDYIQKRLFYDFQSIEVNKDATDWNSIEIRLAIWRCNLAIVKDNPIFGIGFHDEVRDDCYKKYSFYEHYGVAFNAHNQFLEFYVLGGVVLFILFLFFLYYPVKISLERRNGLFIILMALILLHFQTECLLSRVKGVFFISYFVSYFVYLCKSPVELEK